MPTMDKAAIIEIDGCKISPEFIKLVEENISKIPAEAEQFKTDIFNVQTAILIASENEDFRPENLKQLALSLHSVYSFVSELSHLREDGKF